MELGMGWAWDGMGFRWGREFAPPKKGNTVQYNCRAKPKQQPTLTDYGLTAIVALKRLRKG